MDKDVHVSELTLDLLKNLPLHPAYPDEPRDLPSRVKVATAAALRGYRQGAPSLASKMCTGGAERKPSVKMPGTSFWPDIEILSRGMARELAQAYRSGPDSTGADPDPLRTKSAEALERFADRRCLIRQDAR